MLTLLNRSFINFCLWKKGIGWICLVWLFLGSNGSEAAVKMMPSLETGIPFIGVLLSIAFCPLLIPRLWHKYENAILIFWIILSTWLCFSKLGEGQTENIVMGVLVKEYIPFITLISTLFIISNGINIQIHRQGTTSVNVAILFIGEILANFIGTTGTAILLLRPLLEVNRNRQYKVHTIIFFIFLVSNIGGCLLPFGDPPLFLGYLKGIDFFWTAKHMFPLFFIASTALMMVYALLDRFFMKREPNISAVINVSSPCFYLGGSFNIALLIVVVITVAITGILPKKMALTLFDVKIYWKNLIRDGVLVLLSCISVIKGKKINPQHTISWAPLTEVMRYFVAIFITMAPVAIMLKGGHEAFAPIRSALSHTNHMAFLYFWLVAPFSAFLDNAPTYVIFFKMAGGDAATLMTTGAKILTAISASSVFMGAMTYIGNAPNFMILSIAKQYGIKMPGFLGYMGWSCAILLPLFVILTYLFLY